MQQCRRSVIADVRMQNAECIMNGISFGNDLFRVSLEIPREAGTSILHWSLPGVRSVLKVLTLVGDPPLRRRIKGRNVQKDREKKSWGLPHFFVRQPRFVYEGVSAFSGSDPSGSCLPDAAAMRPAGCCPSAPASSPGNRTRGAVCRSVRPVRCRSPASWRQGSG